MLSINCDADELAALAVASGSVLPLDGRSCEMIALTVIVYARRLGAAIIIIIIIYIIIHAVRLVHQRSGSNFTGRPASMFETVNITTHTHTLIHTQCCTGGEASTAICCVFKHYVSYTVSNLPKCTCTVHHIDSAYRALKMFYL